MMEVPNPAYQSTAEFTTQKSESVNIHPLFNEPTPFYVIAHRGAKSDYPENTMPAFKAAVRRGANMIELDVRLSGDGVPVVIHDATVNRTTDAKGKIAAYTADQLQQLDAGSWFRRRYAGWSIPLLEQVIQWLPDDIALNIELKPLKGNAGRHGGIEEKCVNLVKRYGIEDKVLFSSFNYESVHHIESMNPELATGILYKKRQSGNLLPSELVARYETDAFHCSKDQLNKHWIQNLNFHNIPFLIYTVNREKGMQHFYQQGAAGIITDNPEQLYRVINRIKEGG